MCVCVFFFFGEGGTPKIKQGATLWCKILMFQSLWPRFAIGAFVLQDSLKKICLWVPDVWEARCSCAAPNHMKFRSNQN